MLKYADPSKITTGRETFGTGHLYPYIVYICIMMRVERAQSSDSRRATALLCKDFLVSLFPFG